MQPESRHGSIGPRHEVIVADAVVLGTGNLDPAPMRGVAGRQKRMAATASAAWETRRMRIFADAAVALIGSGLTAWIRAAAAGLDTRGSPRHHARRCFFRIVTRAMSR